MSLTQHLLELRKRLAIAALSILAGGVGGWFLFDPFWNYLRSPILAVAHSGTSGDASINYSTVGGAFDVQLQVSIAIGIVISSPVWLYQIFAFLVPGLNKREKRYIFGFFLSAVPLFLGGCAVGFFVMPHLVELLTSFVPKGDSSFLDAKTYLDFVLKIVLATGIAFVLPVFLVLLNFVGVLSGRTILKSWRWAVIAIALFTAIATPATDVYSMLLLAAPMVVLYVAAMAIALLHDRVLAKRERATLDAGLAGA